MMELLHDLFGHLSTERIHVKAHVWGLVLAVDRTGLKLTSAAGCSLSDDKLKLVVSLAKASFAVMSYFNETLCVSVASQSMGARSTVDERQLIFSFISAKI